MAKRRDWSKAPEQSCRYCGAVHLATPKFFSRTPGAATGVSTICRTCNALKRRPASEGMRRCTKCGDEKPATLEYFAAAKTELGLRSDCRTCKYAQVSARSTVVRSQWTPAEHEVHKQKQREGWVRHRSARVAARRAAYDPGKARLQQLAKWGRIKADSKRSACYREYARHSMARYRAANPEGARAKGRALDRAAYARNPEKKLAESKAWRDRNPEKVRAYAARRRAFRLEVPGTFGPEDIQAMFKRQVGRCFYCACEIGSKRAKWHVDHVIPISKGGTNYSENLVLACQTCNLKKHDRMPWEFCPEKFPPPEAVAAD